MAKTIILPRVRLSFVNVYEKGEYQGKESDKFECTGLLPQEGSEKIIAKLKTMIKELLEAKYGAKIPPEFTKWLGDKQFGMVDKLFIRDGDNYSYDGYADHWAIKAANKAQPKLIDSDKSALTAASGKLYSGSYANMMLEVWIMDNQYGKRICANLMALQHVAHGEAFGAGGAVPDSVIDEFDELEADPMDEDDSDY